jgi:ADP-ribose pyrophosphatase YjhB (NUDIX family)
MSHIPGQITVKAMCVFMYEGRLLAGTARDRTTGEEFYRLLGGGVEFGESSEVAIRREMREELDTEIENLQFIKVVENIFVYEGRQGHEVTFVFTGTLGRKELYELERSPILDVAHEAVWVSLEDLKAGKVQVYPELDYESFL